MNPGLILLDFDGTIADTFRETLNIFNHFADKYGYRKVTDEDLPKARSMTVWQLLKFLQIPKHKLPFLLRRGRKMLHRNLDQIALFPGILDLLTYAEQQGVPCGIITSNSKKNVERFIQLNCLPNIHFVRSSSKLMGKPREFKRVFRKRKVTKDEVIYIGDECRDIEAAHECGVKVVAVTWGYNSREALAHHHPDFIVDSVDELIALLAQSQSTIEPA
jgi:phosphoglycolate phosphatase